MFLSTISNHLRFYLIILGSVVLGALAMFLAIMIGTWVMKIKNKRENK